MSDHPSDQLRAAVPQALRVEVPPLARAFAALAEPMHGESAPSFLSLPLQGGSGIATTRPQPVGGTPDFPGVPLLATLSVWYDYEPETRVLTLCRQDLVSSDATHITTFPAGSGRKARHYGYSPLAIHDGTKGSWNMAAARAAAPLVVGARPWDAVLAPQQAVWGAQQAIVDAAHAHGLNVALRTPVPSLAREELAGLRVVYRDGVFKGGFDPLVPLEAHDTLIALHSVWGGTARFNHREAFANVIGSTDDPKIDGLTWRRLWAKEFGPPPQCTSLGFPASLTCTPAGNNSPVGGHVLLGTTPSSVPVGSDKVFIIPICSRHNARDDVHMQAIANQNAVWLHKYFQT
jgi:hypothetical protein